MRLRLRLTWSTAIATTANLLIRRLPADDQRRLVAACEPVEWRLAQVLCEPGALVRHAYFPLSGFLSLVTQVSSRPQLEVGMIGREGMLGAELSLGVLYAPFHVLVQGAGQALRIDSAALASEMAHSDALRLALNRYIGVTLTQLATSTACLRLHSTTARLARWILMSQDRARTPQFALTTAFLAYMLGGQSTGVTTAINHLRQRRLIQWQGDIVSVLDRSGLEAAACSCYTDDRVHYEYQLGL